MPEARASRPPHRREVRRQHARGPTVYVGALAGLVLPVVVASSGSDLAYVVVAICLWLSMVVAIVGVPRVTYSKYGVELRGLTRSEFLPADEECEFHWVGENGTGVRLRSSCSSLSAGTSALSTSGGSPGVI